MNKRNKAMYAVASIAAASWFPTSVYAQAAGQSVAGAIEEVLVTARRREESLQEVPIAITAITGDDLQQRGVDSMQNMNAVAPNLSVMGGGNSGESQANFRVRGIPGVAVYVDGIYQPTTDGLLTMSVTEVDRIEVLRGPQGTVFGQASLGGAIQYVTRAPADTFGARFSATVGEFNRRDFKGSIDVPVTDTFKAKFTAASEFREGFIRSQVIDRAYGDVNDELYRADFLWEPLDSLSVRYNIEDSTTDRVGPARVIQSIGAAQYFSATNYNTNPQAQAYQNALGIAYNNQNYAAGFAGGRVGEYENRIAWENPGLQIDTQRHSLDINFDFTDSLRVRSISGYKELTRAVQVDFDGASDVQLLERDNRGRFFHFSEELQLLGSHEAFDWVVGGYYSRELNRTRTATWSSPEFTCDLWNAVNNDRVSAAQRASCLSLRQAAIAGGQGVTAAQFVSSAAPNGDQMTRTEIEATAFFGDLTWRVTDKFTAALGLRYSEQTNTEWAISGSQLAVRAPTFPDTQIAGDWFGYTSLPTPAEADFDGVTKRLTLQYQWTPDLMTYVGYADGFGPGGQYTIAANQFSGYQDIQTGTFTYGEQTVDNYELGLRADWLGGVVRTNISAFYTEWNGLQASQYIASSYVRNGGLIGDRNGDGVNDITVFPNLITTQVAAAEVKGVEFEGIWRATDALRINLNLGWLDSKYKELGLAGNGVIPAVSLGSTFAQAPEITGNVGAQYEFGFSNGGALVPRLDYTYTDDYVLTSDDLRQSVQEGFGLLNARLTYDSGANWTVSLLGTNLTDEYYLNSGFYTVAEQIDFVTIGRPREVGVTFNFTFE